MTQLHLLVKTKRAILFGRRAGSVSDGFFAIAYASGSLQTRSYPNGQTHSARIRVERDIVELRV